MKKTLLTTTAILLATIFSIETAKAADCVDDNGVAGKSCTFITVDGTEKVLRITYNDNTSTRYSYNGSRKDVYTYDKNRKQTGFTSIDYYDDGTIKSKTENAYENGNKTGYTYTEYYKNGTIKSKTESTQENGKQTGFTSIDYYDDGTIKSKTENAYENGNKTGYTEYTAIDGLTREYACEDAGRFCTLAWTYKYTYDSDGNLTQKITYDSDGTTILGKEGYAKIFTPEQAYAATSKGNHNTFSIRFK